MNEHAPALVVMLPIIGAVLIMLIRHNNLNWGLHCSQALVQYIIQLYYISMRDLSGQYPMRWAVGNPCWH